MPHIEYAVMPAIRPARAVFWFALGGGYRSLYGGGYGTASALVGVSARIRDTFRFGGLLEVDAGGPSSHLPIYSLRFGPLVEGNVGPLALHVGVSFMGVFVRRATDGTVATGIAAGLRAGVGLDLLTIGRGSARIPPPKVFASLDTGFDVVVFSAAPDAIFGIGAESTWLFHAGGWLGLRW